MLRRSHLTQMSIRAHLPRLSVAPKFSSSQTSSLEILRRYSGGEKTKKDTRKSAQHFSGKLGKSGPRNLILVCGECDLPRFGNREKYFTPCHPLLCDASKGLRRKNYIRGEMYFFAHHIIWKVGEIGGKWVVKTPCCNAGTTIYPVSTRGKIFHPLSLICAWHDQNL